MPHRVARCLPWKIGSEDELFLSQLILSFLTARKSKIKKTFQVIRIAGHPLQSASEGMNSMPTAAAWPPIA